ncbi:MAG: hypothetical protein ACJ71N_04315 [Terriglobales bacterium]|jgi:hypothetical protein
MAPIRGLLARPGFTLGVILPIALLLELFVLEGFVGASLPIDRGSGISSYEIQQKGTELHFITRNKRFSIVDLWSKHGTALEALVLRESFVSDRQDGIEGARSTVQVEGVKGGIAKWSFEEPGDTGRPLNQLYEVTKFGCCDAPSTYTYYSLRDGRKVRTSHLELNAEEVAGLEKSLYD